VTVDELGDRLGPYLPGLLRGAVPAEPNPASWTVQGTLVMLDISGFTRLTERLASRGRAGAEELSDILDLVFGPLVEAALAEGCDLLKWGGDAVLMLAVGPQSGVRGARAAALMRTTLARVGHLRTSVGPVVLRASSGVATGEVHLVLGGDPRIHRELMVLGPVTSRVVRTESAAAPGQVLLDSATAAMLPARCVGETAGTGFLLRSLPAAPDPEGHALVDLVVDAATTAAATAARAVTTTDRAHLVPSQLRTHVANGPHEPEHRVATAAFVRFSGTDGLLERDGPAAVTAAVDELVRNVQDATARHGVSFHETDIDHDGGKLMLVAGAPQSTGDDVDHLLATVRLVVDRAGRLPLQVGVAQGRVFTGDLGPALRRTYSVKGGAVNLAARLAARAAAGTISLPAELLEHSRTHWELGPSSALRLKGLAEPVYAVSLGAATSQVLDQAGTAMVGRATELAQVSAALDEVADGVGSVVTVVGPPGMGKTRLVSEVLAGAEDFRVLTAEGGHSGASAPYATIRLLLAQALRLSDDLDPAAALRQAAVVVGASHPHLVPSLPMLGMVFGLNLDPAAVEGELGEEFRSDALHRLVVEVLEAALPTPTVLVVEDAHLVDGDSARVLDQLAVRCADQPWLVLTTRRSVEGAPPGGLVIELGPLDLDASRQMTELVDPGNPLAPGAAKALVARSGGHPLFLRELVLAASRGERIDELPLSVEELVSVQIDALPPHRRSLLRRAAVLGDSFTLALLAGLVEPSAAATLRADVAELATFLEPQGARRWRFRHAVHRETAYAGLPMKVRSRLHGQVGDVLARSPGAMERRPEVLAHHFYAAGRYEQAWRCARLAGVKASVAAAPEAAAQAYALAAEAAQQSGTVPVPERAADLESWGDALFLCGRSGAADRAYARAGRLRTGEPVRSASLALKAAKVAQRQGRHPVALRRTAVGLRLLEGTSDPQAVAARARLLARRSVVLMSQGRYRDAARSADEAVRAAVAAGQDDALAQAHLVLHGVEVFTGSSSEVDHGGTALRLYAGLGDLSGQAHAHNNIAMRRLLQGRWSEALEGFQRAAADFDQVGDVANAANAAYNSADLLNRQGRPQQALEVLGGVLRIARAVDDEELRALVLREQGRAHHRAGRPAEGEALLAEARALFHELHEPHEVCETDIAAAEGQVLAGLFDEALRATDRALEAVTRLGAATLLPAVHRVRASAQVQRGDLPAAWTSLKEGLAASSAPDLAHERGFLLAVQAHLESLDGAVDGDRHSAAEADHALELLGVVRAPLPWLAPVDHG
jgi:class 3 adenylate cyclase/tetratricopeptide (TPR) repeat protein